MTYATCAVCCMSKIVIRKQFTTANIFKKSRTCCMLYVKDSNSKAIHNWLALLMTRLQAVCCMSKIVIRKQFTTGTANVLKSLVLYAVCQR